MIDLGAGGGISSYATGINDSGQIVGYFKNLYGYTHAFRIADNNWIDMETMGGTESEAYGINKIGQIVGHSMMADYLWHAFRYYHGWADLGIDRTAWAINDRGQIVGYFWVPDSGGISHAFLYEANMKDLGTLGGDNSRAFGINKDGQIVGDAQNAASQYRPFLYNPPRSSAALSLLLFQ